VVAEQLVGVVELLPVDGGVCGCGLNELCGVVVFAERGGQ